MESLATLMQLLGAGILLGRTDLLESGQVLLRLTGLVTLPALILQSGYRHPVYLGQWAFAASGALISIATSILVTWVVARKRRAREKALLLGLAGSPCLASVPLAFLSAAFGGAVVQVAAVFAAVHVLAGTLFYVLLCRRTGIAPPHQFVHQDGGRYSGQWRGQAKHGLGVYLYPSGAKYAGEWQDGVKDGCGVYTFPKGGTYEGEWAAGERSGIGIRTFRDGRVSAGFWQEGSLAHQLEASRCAAVAEGAEQVAVQAGRVLTGSGWDLALHHLLPDAGLLAVLAGTALQIAGLPLPASIDMVTSVLARLHVPLVMLGLGASLPTAAPPQLQWQDLGIVLCARHAASALCLAALAILGRDKAWATLVLLVAISALGPTKGQAKDIANQLNLTSPTLAESTVSMSALLSAVLLTVAVAAHMHLSPAPAAAHAPQLAFVYSGSILAGRKWPQLLKTLQPASPLRCAPSCCHQPGPACYRRQWMQQYTHRQQRTSAPHLQSAWRQRSCLLAHA